MDSTPDNNVASEDDQDIAVLATQQIDLSLTKLVNDSSPNVGDNVVFTITLANAGPDTATTVRVEDVLPTGLSYVSSSATQGSYSSITDLWTVGTVGNGGSETLTITATVSSAGTYTNTAQVENADQQDVDSTPDNNIASEDDQDNAVLATQQIDLSLTKSVNDSSPNVGDNVVFTITLANAGPDTATTVRVEDVLPTGLSYVSSSATQGSYSSITDLWTVGTVGNGGSETLTLTATVTAAGTYTNTAQVENADQQDVDSTPDNNIASEDDQDNAVLATQQIDPVPDQIGQ